MNIRKYITNEIVYTTDLLAMIKLIINENQHSSDYDKDADRRNNNKNNYVVYFHWYLGDWLSRKGRTLNFVTTAQSYLQN